MKAFIVLSPYPDLSSLVFPASERAALLFLLWQAANTDHGLWVTKISRRKWRWPGDLDNLLYVTAQRRPPGTVAGEYLPNSYEGQEVIQVTIYAPESLQVPLYESACRAINDNLND